MSVRLALLISMRDWSAGYACPPPVHIKLDHCERAVMSITEHLLPMPRRTWAEATSPPKARSARRLARLIRDERPEPSGAREIYRRKLAGLKTAEQVKAAIRLLIEVGVLRADETKTDGRKSVLYDPNPLIWEA